MGDGIVVVWNQNLAQPVLGEVNFGFGNEESNTFSDPQVANETSENYQTFSDVDSDDDRFAIVWSQGGGFLDTNDTFVRVFAADGTPLTSEIRVNQNDTGGPSHPEVAFLADGTFVVVWENSGVDGSGAGVSGRHFSADGTPLGDEFTIPSDSSRSEFAVSITALADGGFVVAWSVYDSIAEQPSANFRIFDADAVPIGPSQNIDFPEYSDDASTYSAYRPRVTTLSSGDFVITGFFDDRTDDFGPGLFLRRFLPDGTLVDWEGSFVTVGDTSGFVRFPTVQATPDGGVIVAFSLQSETSDIAQVVFFRTDADGELVFAAPISTGELTDANEYLYVRPTVGEDGRVVFVYQGFDSDTSQTDVLLRIFESVLYGTENGGILPNLPGAQRFEGGIGDDTVDYTEASGRVLADLQIDQSAAAFARFFVDGAGAGDEFVSIEHVIGGRFADNLRGDGGANLLAGGGFSDRLYGRSGNDTLDGGAGADALYGNLGADVLTGGDDSARDRFIFFSLSESTPEGRDTITDFTPGEDRIEISRIDADITQGFRQDFDWIGDDALSGTAGELGYRTEGGNTIVQADVDGDAIADFEIELTGTLTLSESDFLL
ncbi:M10 family metallopeptidase C-terminal domain-containing protein [Thalassococcus lentus]|uniref:M10 family metallopeptidase C-terminal domain-containing protein n=1 Tax=Thalassococcus lentus TaxID=1210524 RepID=A0ABT4XVV4_9RHOB|nr:M10 family metallopeptidase C-terminal domain-containing protein [Thalassococcus lentus]MDA7425975.1 M10 family metallopeptidase C-terminal domain-containing protein [Thalassococcus lentus]